MTGCTARCHSEDHDYTQPPHNTAATPRPCDGDEDTCQAGWDGCEDEQRYWIVLYQWGTHDWIRMITCTSCAAGLLRWVGPDGPIPVAQVGLLPAGEGEAG